MATKFWSSIQNINNWRSSAKTNVLFNLISQQPYIDKVYLYAKDSYEAKHKFLTNKHEGLWLNHFNDSKAFIEYSNDMGDIYESIKKCYSKKKKKKKRKTLLVFDDMIVDMPTILLWELQTSERFNK